VIAGNRATNGGAVYFDAPQSGIDFDNAIVVRNHATDGAGSVQMGGESFVTFAYSDFWRNSGPMAGSHPGTRRGNVSVDPQFVNYTPTDPFHTWDFHLAPGSPLIDAGDPDLVDPDGTRSDMGAYGGPGGAWQ
jgi:hypothetical protein